MRVLAIRGSNLASLEGPFDVDFRAQPLAGAGVFAITGPTGAGKSTLLDALAVALYHQTPRLKAGAERGSSVPDAGDDAGLSPSDPRTLLRRGCGEGHAEVDFVGIDGRPWIARWSVRRAHGRADGKLQAAQAELRSGADDALVASGIREVREAIEQRLGLDYAQFCRAVLLAQNEFAGFLRAPAGERAALLEALTGTTIYRQLSRLAHQRNHEEQQTLKLLGAQLERDPPLAEEQRSQLEEQREQLQASLTTVRAAIDAMRTELAWHEEGERLRQRQAAARAELQRRDEQLQARAGDRAALARHQAAGAARPLLDELRRAEQAVQAQQTRHEQLQAALAAADNAAEAAAAAVTDAEQALTAQEGVRRDAAPRLVEARALDGQISAVAGQLQQQAEAHAEAETVRAARHGRQRAAAQVLNANEHSLRAWDAWRADHPQWPSATAEWAALGGALDLALQTAGQLEACGQALAEVEARAAGAALAKNRAEQQLQAAEQALDSAAATLARAQQAEDAVDATALQQRAQAVQARREALAVLERLLDAHARQEQRWQREASALQRERDALQGEQAQLAQLLAERPVREAAALQAERALQRSRAIADQHSARLRQQLVDGEPCPVCGSRDHPGLADPPGEVEQLLAALAEEAQHSRHALDTLRQRCAALEAGCTQRAARINESQILLSELCAELDGLAGQALTQTARLEVAVDAVASLTVAVPALRASLDAQARSSEQDAQALEQLRAQRREAAEALERARQALAEARAQTERLRVETAPLLAELETCRQRRQASRERWDTASRRLGDLLDRPAAVPAADLACLQADWQAGEALRQTAEQAAGQSVLLRDALQQACDEVAQAEAAAQRISEQLDALRQSRQVLLQQRRALFESTNLDQVEQALQQAVDTAARTLAATRQRQQQAREHRLALQRDLGHIDQLQQQSRRQQADASAALAAWLTRHAGVLGLAASDVDALAALLDTPSEPWRQLADALRAQDQARKDAEVACRTLDEQLEDWQQRGQSIREADELREALQQSLAGADGLQDSLSVVQAQLAEDGLRRQQNAALLAQIAAQQSRAEDWARLDTLIGSANGDSFQRHAQRYTLEVLVGHANAQLRRLAPRYRLRQAEDGLGLLVADEDMGGELRGVQSLSGGETFLASLALALGLAELASQRVRVESLFIDEGFGSLDLDTLRVAMDALDRLQAEGRKVGVISHVQELSERIGVQVRVEPQGGGRSRVSVDG